MKPLLTIVLSILLVSFGPPGEADYKKIFGDKYTWAENWVGRHDALIREYAAEFNIPHEELEAIVFPELIRYNAFFDAIEVESLKFLYVKEGNEYANFSVGYFQMKPSFAEQVEKDAIKFLPQKYRMESGWITGGGNTEESRRERVKRLSNVRQQLLYLCAFYKICDKKFSGHRFKSPEEKVKLFATCYNAGYHRTFENLVTFYSKKQFYSYNYSDVSVFYFMRNAANQESRVAMAK